jgi:alkylation response protein AidB-like acyl-CoA dehydrogenase
MIAGLQFDPIALPPETEALRANVRSFIAEERRSGTLANRDTDGDGYCPEFSRKLGANGWLGMMWPKEYGGQARTAFDRYVVNEELLVSDAPTSAHFVADRQSGPLLLRFGTDDHKRTIVPAIARGELTFCIGMSEPHSGSDLASVQTSARKTDGGWVINGTKLWTSWAHRADYMITLVRTSPLEKDRHKGLSQFLVDMKSPGIEVRPIINLKGHHDFNEIMLTDCFVPDSMMVGGEGQGWSQVTSELGYERSGPERFLSTFALFRELVRAIGPHPNPTEAAAIGRMAAHMMTLRRMSISVAGMLQEGRAPNVEAAVVKDLGTSFEREMPEIARLLWPAEPSRDADVDAYTRALGDAMVMVPKLTIQGGTREILRVVIARGLGLR